MSALQTAPAILRRPRLLDRLHAAVGGGLTVIQAPAGFGKSTLVESFAGEVDFKVAWVSLDASSTVPEVLAVALARALAGPSAGVQPQADTGQQLRAYLSVAIDECSERDPRPLLLVIDNTQALSRAVESSELLGWLFESLPPESEVVLIGREGLPLTEIDRRVTGGECLFIGPEDLAFTLAETRELATARGWDFDVEAAHLATGGWPIAVAGVVSGTVPLGDASSLTAPGAWERFVAREVWADVPEPLREPLLRLSVLTSIDTRLATALVGRAAWQSLRQWLAPRGFLSDHNTESTVRLNESFRHFLRARLLTDHPRLAEEATRAVITRLMESGAIADAILVAIDMDDLDLLAHVLEEHANVLLLQGAFALLRLSFDSLGAVNIDQMSPLNGVRLRVLVHTGFPEAALEQAAALLRKKSVPAETRFHALLAQIRALKALGRDVELTRLFDETRESVIGADPVLVADYYFQQAQHALHRTADYARADALLKSCYEIADECGAVQLATLARSTRGDLLLLLGNAPAALDELIRAASGWRRAGARGNLAWTLNNLGLAHITVGDFVSAIAVLDESRQEAIAIEDARMAAYAVATMGDCRLAQGDPAAARALYEEALQQTAVVLDPTLTLFSLIGLSACALGTGEIRHADFLANRALELGQAMANRPNLASCQLQLAATHSASGDHLNAERFASEALATFEELDSAISARIALYRLALVKFAAGDRTGAEDCLQRLSETVTEAWMLAALAPAIHQNPMFAQWAASRQGVSPILAEGIGTEVNQVASAKPAEDVSALPRIAVRSLGQLVVELNGEPVSDSNWATARAKELFFLFLANPQGIRKEEAVVALSPDLSPAKSNSTFHSNLHRLRKALFYDVIVREDNVYRLNPAAAIEWDVEQFAQALENAQRHASGTPERAAAYERAVSLYRGPFAPEFFGEWADAIRDRIERQNLQTLSSLAGFYAARGDHERAAEQLELVLTANPFNEEAVHMLALSRAKAGNPIAAIGTLDDYGRRIDSELGQRLPPRLQQLRASIAAGVAI
ncbi:MAG: BTAD domain-containing putative transcriptional regulator [Dehalococcoidia bacterium]